MPENILNVPVQSTVSPLRSRRYLVWEQIKLPSKRPPSIITNFRLGRAVTAVVPLSYRAAKLCVHPLRSRRYLNVQEVEISVTV